MCPSEQPSNDSTAEALLAATTEIIATAGFEALRLRPLAERVGVALGTPSYRFKNRQGLLVAAIDRANRMQSEATRRAYDLGADEGAYNAVYRFVFSRITFALEHPYEALLRAHAVYSNAVPGVREAIGRFADDNVARTFSLVGRLEADGLLDLETDEERAFVVQSLNNLGFAFSQSTALFSVDPDGALDPEQLRAMFGASLEMVLQGARRPRELFGAAAARRRDEQA